MINFINRIIVRKVVAPLFLFFNKDYFSSLSIFRRKDMEKIGTSYGGWFIPATLVNSNSIIYCAGCGEDISFDLGVIERYKCQVYAFDPTPKAIEYVNKVTKFNKNYHFFEFGLWDKNEVLKFYVPKNASHVSHSIVNLQNTNNYISAEVRRLSDIMIENGHQKINILKLDIEGAEYKVISSLIEDNLNVDIICVEYDEYFNPLDKFYRSRIIDSIDSLLLNGYSLVYSEGNGNYTFIKKYLL